MKKLELCLIVLALTLYFTAQATEPTKIGNGDDGSDLEGFTKVTKGSIVEAQKNAVQLLKSLNIPGVKTLGTLLPEVENTDLYVTKKDVQALENTDAGAFHADMKGRVYARTLAEPHAVTRFFPVATKLENDQLVALHIHEGLHRSLPASVREDERVVSAITLAITTPGANFDSVQRVVTQEVPEAGEPLGGMIEKEAEAPESSRAKKPSLFGYAYRSFQEPKQYTSYPVSSMQVVNTKLYPFSMGKEPFGLGFEFSLVKGPTKTIMGPLGISADVRAWTVRGFDIGFWGTLNMNTLSNEELKSSPYGRDTFQLGLSIKKDLATFSIENFLSYIFKGDSSQKIGNVTYKYEYGSVVVVSTHPALMAGPIRAGGFLEVALGDYYKVQGGAFSYDPGRYRLVSGGPEVQCRFGDVTLGVAARFLIDSTPDASYDSLGDLLGMGAAQGNVTASLSIFF